MGVLLLQGGDHDAKDAVVKKIEAEDVFVTFV